MKSILILFSSLLLFTHNHDYKVGELATDFSLPNIDGEMVSLSDYDDAKGFIVIFTCNTCPYSIAYEDRVNALDAKYKSKGYPVIAINPNDPAAKDGEELSDMKQRGEDKNFTFPYLQDKGQKVYPKFGATRTPHVFILEKQDKGNVVQYIGAIDDSSRNPDKVEHYYVEDAVDALLAGQLPKVNTTKAIGCSIKTL
ncbi:thioredoxin family protein [Flavobacteriaceae bacterium]|nr:thioredoxin family protein [Flavobacteriaceae bacterium]